MKIIAFPRTEKGSGASRRLRNTGMAPGIVYGGTSAPVNIKLDHNALFYALKREAFHSSILDMEIEGKTEQVLLRDYQMHAYKPLVLHIDFQRVSANQKITVKIPLHFVNESNSPAIKLSSGAINHAVTDLEISCLPKDLPEFIEVDLSKIDVGQSIHLSDLKLPAGVTASGQNDMTLASAIAVVAKLEPEAEAPEGEAKTDTESKE